jgi:hypothetical protein
MYVRYLFCESSCMFPLPVIPHVPPTCHPRMFLAGISTTIIHRFKIHVQNKHSPPKTGIMLLSRHYGKYHQCPNTFLKFRISYKKEIGSITLQKQPFIHTMPLTCHQYAISMPSKCHITYLHKGFTTSVSSFAKTLRLFSTIYV